MLVSVRHAAQCRCDPVNSNVIRFGTRCVVAAERVLYSAGMKVAEVLRQLHDEGWNIVAIRGNHRQFKHPSKPGRVTVAGKPSDDLASGTLNSIRKQAGLK